jgi:cyanobactin maturation PatA/PatG family protease
MSRAVIEASAVPTALDQLPGIQDLWAESLGDKAVRIAVLDGPADLSHACFQGAQLEVADFVTSRAAGSVSQHGTHIASILFGQPGSPVQGIAPGCTGLIIPIFSESADGTILPCSQMELGRTISLAVGRGANIINISGGQLEPSGKAHPALEAAVRLCAENDVLIVAAAGNDGCQCLHVPAALSSVLVVGAMDADGRPLEFSNWSPAYAQTGILAQGDKVVGAIPGGKTGVLSGTSCATPIVAGVAALLLSIQRQRGREQNINAVRDALMQSAITCEQEPVSDCHRLLAGRLNIRGALTKILKGAEAKMSEHVNAAEISTPQAPQADKQPAAPSAPVVAAAATSAAATPQQTASAGPAAGNGEAANKSSAQIYASACKCGCQGGASAQLIYELGTLGYDFRTETNRDYFAQQMEGKNPFVPSDFLAHLEQREFDAKAVTWVLRHEDTPMYAIEPAGPFAAETYKRLRDYFKEQVESTIERVSIPGVLIGTNRLLNGQEVPVIIPDIRGMYNWTTAALIREVVGDPPEGYPDNDDAVTADSPLSHQNHKQLKTEIRTFLDRVYFDTRNFGISSQERAINYTATNAFQLAEVFKAEIGSGYKLAGIDIDRSLVCRPGTDCWDVKLSFFNPPKRFELAKKVYRFTVDVTEVIPVTVGSVKGWEEY